MLNCKQHKTCIKDALAKAEKVCLDAGAKLTTTRRQVLELLWKSHQPRKAYDLLADLDATAKPPTVYRALEFLQEHGLVHKVESLNAFIGCDGMHSHQYLICQGCGDVSDIHDETLAKTVQAKAHQKGFQVTSPIIEIKGICERCHS